MLRYPINEIQNSPAVNLRSCALLWCSKTAVMLFSVFITDLCSNWADKTWDAGVSPCRCVLSCAETYKLHASLLFQMHLVNLDYKSADRPIWQNERTKPNPQRKWLTNHNTFIHLTSLKTLSNKIKGRWMKKRWGDPKTGCCVRPCMNSGEGENRSILIASVSTPFKR
jgi:hypothetical protein